MTVITPSIILVKPQLPENIGLVARAMDNCGLKNLILVSPREKWPNNLSLQSSANSKKIILNTRVFRTLNEALANFNFIIATSNRKRFLNKPFQDDFVKLFDEFPKNKKIGILFGPENSGLSNQDLMLADTIFNINSSKTNTSLNLSHAVLLISYKWREYFITNKKTSKNNKLNNKQALKKDFLHFMNFLKNELEDINFLYPKSKSNSMFNNIQTLFMRSALSKTEIQTLWGMIKKLRK